MATLSLESQHRAIDVAAAAAAPTSSVKIQCTHLPLIGRGLTFGSADDNALEPVDDSASGQSNQG
jgi:hypothetical protein